MTTNEVILRINESIVEVISHYVELKRHGITYEGCCPFHQERTPSFKVNEAKGIYKCFGCGKGGDAIDFLMSHEGVEFMEALKIGAGKLNLEIDWEKKDSDFSEEEFRHKEALRIVCQKAADFYRQCLRESPVAKEYLEARGFCYEEEDPLGIGYAPGGNALMKWAQEQGLNLTLMKEAGLIGHSEERGQDYDFFRERIVFPICEKGGKVIGFSGRILVEKKGVGKYINSPDSAIYNKGHELYGLNVARHAIKKEDRVYLVEGNFDVKRLHSIGVLNVVAPCGTALTVEQIRLLKGYTRKITQIYDADKAGRAAIERNGDLMIKEQCSVNVMLIEDKEDPTRKVDPDVVFTSIEKFEEYKDSRQQNYLNYKTELRKAECQKDPAYKSEVIKNIVGLIGYYEESSMRDVMLDSVSEILKPKKLWQDTYKAMVAEKPVEKRRIMPHGEQAEDLLEWGFYAENNCYWFKDSKGEPHQRSNFVLTPLFHIESTLNAKRLYEVKNENGIVRVVEIPQKDMVSLTAFQIHIESLGNFWFDGTQADLNRLKRWLYSKTETCKELVQLGWQKEGFWAWGNGIFNDEFTPVDSYGIVRHGKKNYYIPAFSSIFEKEEGLYQFERKFIHIESNITLREYCQKFVRVFGSNAKIALCFYFAALFRDVVIKRFGIFPILNMFGPKGAGKTACAESLVQFFGRLGKAPNVHNTSLAALGEHVATSCNAICHIDEYRNDIEMMKREFLKGIWDGSGRSKLNMDKDKKKEMSLVDQALVLTGQQMATSDIALMSRFIFLSFTQVEYSDKEREEFVGLKEIEKRGLTHLTHQILRLRGLFKERFFDHVKVVNDRMREMMGLETVEDRIFNNWLIPIAAYSTLADNLELPWDEMELTGLAVKLMIGQNQTTKKNDDLGNFWKVVQYLISSNTLYEDGDYKVVYEDKITRRFFENKEWGKEEIELKGSSDLLYLTTSRVFSLYKAQCLKEGDKPLPESTIDYYLRNSAAFICETKKESFKKIDPRTGQQETGIEVRSGIEYPIKKRTSTTALVFYLERTGLTIKADEEEASNTENNGLFSKEADKAYF